MHARTFALLVGRGNNLTSFRRYISSKRVSVLGVPFNKGQRKPGVEKGPSCLRNAGLIKDLQIVCSDVVDAGDVSYKPLKNTESVKGMIDYDHVIACQKEVSRHVSDIVKSGRLCLTVGGDHSIAVGTIHGHLRASGDVAVLWVDAHADLNTPSSTPTGNAHGMPMSMLLLEMEKGQPVVPAMDWVSPRMPAQNLAYIGLRALDVFEKEQIEKLGIMAFGMEDVEELGVTEVVRRALQKINPNGSKSLHVSFDIDSLDELEAPSTGTAVRGGLTLREGLVIVNEAVNTGKLDAFDLVEVNPEIGDQKDVNRTVEAALEICMAAVGYKRGP